MKSQVQADVLMYIMYQVIKQKSSATYTMLLLLLLIKWKLYHFTSCSQTTIAAHGKPDQINILEPAEKKYLKKSSHRASKASGALQCAKRAVVQQPGICLITQLLCSQIETVQGNKNETMISQTRARDA